MLAGICGAGDGFVVQITEPVQSDLDGKPSKIYMNRKGFFALLVQAFCGADTNFWYFRVGWPGATNDITAYKQTPLHHNSTNPSLPTSVPGWVSFLLDEAYSSIGGCHLTPYTQHQLKKSMKIPDPAKTLYYKMRTSAGRQPVRGSWPRHRSARTDRKSTRLNSSHVLRSRMPSSA